MSKPAFKFPPPPPPPPKKDAPAAGSYVNPNDYGGRHQNSMDDPLNRSSDRGNGFGGGRGRGLSRGTYHGHQARGTHGSSSRGRESDFGGVNQESLNAEGSRYGTSNFTHRGASPSPSNMEIYGHQSAVRSFPQGLNASQKRDHTTAFNVPSQRGTRPQAPPAIPSFLSSIPGLSPASTQLAAAPATENKSKTRKRNQLGLTPASQDAKSSSDDEDEEVKLAITASQSGVQFEYRGQTSTLKSAADVAAWLTERRRKFPTQAKAEKAKKDAEEKRRKWEEEKKARKEDARQRREQRELSEREKKELRPKLGETRKAKSDGKGGDEGRAVDTTEKAHLKTEKLLNKAAKARKQLAKADDALRKAQRKASVSTANFDSKERSNQHAEAVHQDSTLAIGTENTAPLDLDESNSLFISSDLSDSETTSSSGSSSPASDSEYDSASDARPETQTTKRTAPDRVLAPPRKDPRRNVCRVLLKNGRCKFGEKCRYSHELPEGKRVLGARNKTVGVVSKRKSLYQIMLEKEEEEERRLVLQSIISMGEAGLRDGDDKGASV